MTSNADHAAANYDFVFWLAQTDDRAIVSSAAWNAILSDPVDEAIVRFLEEELQFAEDMAEATKARNKDFITYVLATHTADHSPEVVAAARAATTDSARELFVRTGYAAAKQRDRHARDTEGRQAAALVQADREYVARLRDHAPGAQVRSAAAWALREDAVDGDVVEFFTHGWAGAARLDLQGHRRELIDNDQQWRSTIHRLVADAEAAEAAARQTAGEAGVQARATAARAWAAVGGKAGPARVAWSQAEQVALAQASAWQAVAAAAAAAQSPNWEPIAGTADEIRQQWERQKQQNTAQSAFWTSLYDRALAAELAMQTGTC